jgi:protein TonB
VTDELSSLPAPPPITERLGSTLFVAALVHGVLILGVTFTAVKLREDVPAPALNVTLIVDTHRDEAPPQRADFLANRNQRGGGAAAPGDRPTTALSGGQPLAQLGEPTGADPDLGVPRERPPSAPQVATRSTADTHIPAVPAPDAPPTQAPQKPALLVDQTAPQTLATEVDVRAELPKSGDRTMIATPSTERSVLAEYLDSWRRRVERIGTANYPAKLLGTAHGKPTLEVTINADGSLATIVVQRSSGDKALDQAALKILRLAAPFEPLPANVRDSYDRLRFAYEWDFFSDAARSANARR